MYPFLIGWISYALCEWIFTYATNHVILRNAKNKFVLLYNTKTEFCFAVQKVMSDSFIYCNLCSHVIEKSHERVLLVKGWKQFDVGSSKE